MDDTSRQATPVPPDLSEAQPGHLPLLWLLAPLVLVYTVCFACDWHAPKLGLALLLAGGGGAAFLAWARPCRTHGWCALHLSGVTGVALLLFATQVPPLPDRNELPPREARLTLRWEQVFATRPEAKTVSGVARVLDAPPYLAEIIGTDLYCQVRKPVPPVMRESGTVFDATGVLDTARRQITGEVSAGFLRYLENRRAILTLTRGRLEGVVAPPSAFQSWCTRQAGHLENVLRHGLENHPASADLFAAIMLGKTSGISRETRADFARTGTLHLFSVSGLHVGVIAAALFWVGRRIRFPNTPWRILVIGIMFVFVMVTGGSAAAMRAWLMVSCILAARFVSRRGSAGGGLVLAATGVLLWEPRTLLDIGFQLSYGVVAALVFYGIPLSTWIQQRWQPWADLPTASLAGWQRATLRTHAWLAGSLGIGTAATLASAPLVVTHFNLFSAGSILANLVIVPVSFPVMVLGFVSLALGTAGAGMLAVPFNWLAGMNLLVLGAITEFFSRLPGMAWTLTYRAPWLGTVTTLLLLGVFLAMPFSPSKRGWLFLLPPLIALGSFLLGAR